MFCWIRLAPTFVSKLGIVTDKVPVDVKQFKVEVSVSLRNDVGRFFERKVEKGDDGRVTFLFVFNCEGSSSSDGAFFNRLEAVHITDKQKAAIPARRRILQSLAVGDQAGPYRGWTSQMQLRLF